jgi:hypothetical protein
MTEPNFEVKKKRYKELNQAFGEPCIVHATTHKHFLNVFATKILRTQSEKDLPESEARTHSAMLDKYIHLDDTVFFTPGFSYNTMWDEYPYGFIFSIKRIDAQFEIFKIHIVLHLAKTCMRFWLKNEPELFLGASEEAKKLIDDFKRTDADPKYDFEGLPGGYFPFWFVNKEFENWFNNTKHKNELVRLFHNAREHVKVRGWFPLFNVRHMQSFAEKVFRTSEMRNGEMVSHRSISLDDPNFKGFFIYRAFSEPEKYLNERVKKELRTFFESCKRIRKDRVVIFDGNTSKNIIDCIY